MKWLQIIKLLFIVTVVTISSPEILANSKSVLETEPNLSQKISKSNFIKSNKLNILKIDSNINKQKPLTRYRNDFPTVIAVIPEGSTIKIFVVIAGTVVAAFFGIPLIVLIEQDEVGIVYKKFGRSIPDNRQIALNGEMGIQVDTLNPGRHFLFPFWMYIVDEKKAIQIGKDKIGLVEAKDGKSLPSGKMFGDAVECNDFQNGCEFINQGGQRGQQLAILRNGIYRINTYLFEVKESPITHICENEIGLVEAKDGQPLPPGANFGRVVECSNFEDAQSFINNGGYRGKQLKILTAGQYAINTKLFEIKKVAPIKIEGDEVGLVEAKDGQPLPPGANFGRVVECNYFQDAEAFINNGGQRGKQLAILPPGSYDINTELFKVCNVPLIKIPLGEIGLVIAQNGTSKLPVQILSKTVDSKNFQDADAFMKNGGQKGKQRAILTSGTYRINTELFTVITSKNAKEYGMKPEALKVYTVESDKIGIATTLDGKSLLNGNIAAPIIDGHNKFQDVQNFIDAGGYRGLQEEILEEGSWNLNPWFVKVEEVPLTSIKAGTVGVVISNIGHNVEQNDKQTTDESEFNIVSRGYKGIEDIPLEAGKYPINTRVKNIVIVPTHEITLDWTDRNKQATDYDSNLKTLELRSKDGFIFKLEVTQVINIASKNAPKMISRVGSPMTNNFYQVGEKLGIYNQASDDAVKYSSIQNLVARVLEPMVGSYFRNAAQEFDALDFLQKRDQIQEGAMEHIKSALNAYGVQAVGTFINEIDLPDELEKPIKAQKIIEIESATLEKERKKEKKLQEFITEQKITESQPELLEAEYNTKIVEENAKAEERKAEAKTKAQKLKNDEDLRRQKIEVQIQREVVEIDIWKQREKAKIDAETQKLEKQLELEVFKETLKTLSPELYTKIETDKRWAEAFSQFKFTAPTTLITGGSGNNSSGLEALYSGEFQTMFLQMLQDRLSKKRSNNLHPDNLNSENLIDASLDQIEGSN